VLVVHRRVEPRARLARRGAALAAMLLAAAITFGALHWHSPAGDAQSVTTEATR